MHWLRFGFIRFCLAMMAGIMLGHYFFPMGAYWPFTLAMALVFVLWALLAPAAMRRTWSLPAGLFVLMLACLTGISLVQLENPARRVQHFMYQPDSMVAWKGTIVQPPVIKAGRARCIVMLSGVYYPDSTGNYRWQQAEGKVHLSISLETDSALYQALPVYGDQLLVKGRPQLVAEPSNPATFDWQAYLARRQVLHQQYVKSSSVFIQGNAPPWKILALASAVRNKGVGIVERYIGSDTHRAVLIALMLGVKDNLDNDMVRVFSATGTMHILAVSGLHVGIIYKLLLIMLGWMLRFRKPLLNLLYVGAIMAALWFYAFVTGFSPSVFRAVVMCSFVLLAQTGGRKSNIYNTMAITAIVLLATNPYSLWEVGFQLSFAAVLGIVSLYPFFEGMWPVQHRLLKPVWSLACVSLAAQLATAPLGLFYFHSFPNYFLLSNLLMVPLAIAALHLGILMLLTSFIPVLASGVAICTELLLSLLIGIGHRVETLPGSLTANVYIGMVTLLLLYVVLVGLFQAYTRGWKLALLAAMLAACGIGIVHSVQWWQAGQQTRMAVLDTGKGVNLFLQYGKRQWILADSMLLAFPTRLTSAGNGFTLQSGIKEQHYLPLSGASEVTDYALLSKDGFTVLRNGNKLTIHVYKRNSLPKELPADVLIVSRQALSSLNNISCRVLVLDASNSRSYALRIKKEAEEKGILCHDIAQQGAFIYDF